MELRAHSPSRRKERPARSPSALPFASLFFLFFFLFLFLFSHPFVCVPPSAASSPHARPFGRFSNYCRTPISCAPPDSSCVRERTRVGGETPQLNLPMPRWHPGGMPRGSGDTKHLNSTPLPLPSLYSLHASRVLLLFFCFSLPLPPSLATRSCIFVLQSRILEPIHIRLGKPFATQALAMASLEIESAHQRARLHDCAFDAANADACEKPCYELAGFLAGHSKHYIPIYPIPPSTRSSLRICPTLLAPKVSKFQRRLRRADHRGATTEQREQQQDLPSSNVGVSVVVWSFWSRLASVRARHCATVCVRIRLCCSRCWWGSHGSRADLCPAVSSLPKFALRPSSWPRLLSGPVA